jgi:hypothetical protein
MLSVLILSARHRESYRWYISWKHCCCWTCDDPATSFYGLSTIRAEGTRCCDELRLAFRSRKRRKLRVNPFSRRLNLNIRCRSIRERIVVDRHKIRRRRCSQMVPRRPRLPWGMPSWPSVPMAPPAICWQLAGAALVFRRGPRVQKRITCPHAR